MLKNCVHLFIILIVALQTPLFAIYDMLLRPANKEQKILYKNSPATYLQSQHFRLYGSNERKILDIAEYVWHKEVEEFGFKAPSSKKIDIYIANRNIRGKDGNLVTIPSYMSGYASVYQKEPYFVLNLDVDEDILKVTIAHEFFHMIQFAYGFYDVNESLWEENLWFLEASATLMEDLVYDEINDYVNFLGYYLPYTYFSLNYANGGIEYGKSIFVRFLVKRFGMNFLRNFFAEFDFSKDTLENLKDKITNFDRLMLDYGVCLSDLKECFDEGYLYPSLHVIDIDDSNVDIGYYGIGLLYTTRTYRLATTPSYYQIDVQKNSNIFKKGSFILLNTHKQLVSSVLLRGNEGSAVLIPKGWSLLHNICNEPMNLKKIPAKIIWVYRNGEYTGWSNVPNLQIALQKSNLLLEDTQWRPGEGVWIYNDDNISIDFQCHRLATFDKIQDNQWHITNFSSATYRLQDVKGKYIVWAYRGGMWYLWKTDKKSKYTQFLDLNVSKGLEGLFIKKRE